MGDPGVVLQEWTSQERFLSAGTRFFALACGLANRHRAAQAMGPDAMGPEVMLHFLKSVRRSRSVSRDFRVKPSLVDVGCHAQVMGSVQI